MLAPTMPAPAMVTRVFDLAAVDRGNVANRPAAFRNLRLDNILRDCVSKDMAVAPLMRSHGAQPEIASGSLARPRVDRPGR